MQNFTAILNPASYFGYNHLSRSYSALRNAMIETLKMPKIAKLPRLNSANDAQIRKKFRFVQEIGPRSWPVRKSKMSHPPGPFERIGQFFFENLIWSARLLFFSPFFFKLSVWGVHFPICLKNLNKTLFLEFTQSFFFNIYACFCVKFTNFKTLKLYITSNFFKRNTVPGNSKTY